MAFSYDIDEVPPADDVPRVEHDIRRAKKFLQKHSPESGDSLYDHLTELLAKILAEQPKNAVDTFEEYSRRLKEERFKTRTDHLRDIYVPPGQYENAKKLIELFQSVKPTDESEQERIEEVEDDGKRQKPNVLDLLFYFEQTDVGLPRSEMVVLNLAIRKLMSNIPLENVRFWGKILGKPKNYYVVEGELAEDELNRRLEQAEAEEEAEEEARGQRKETEIQAAEEAKAAGEEAAATKAEKETVDGPAEFPSAVERGKSLKLVFPPMPVNTWKPPTEVAPERNGTGTNKKVYFVCNSPGVNDWVELPPVTPQQIVIARQIVRYFTGNLDTPIHTFPPFPGTEKNYLRAQIARISGSTHVSPIGFFTFGEDVGEEQEEEEEIGREKEDEGSLSENVHYDPLPVKDLVDPSMVNWCHHSPYILMQGRTVWWSPGKEEKEEIDEEVEEEEEIERGETDADEMEKEIGPPLLTPLSEDAAPDSVMPWTAKQSSYIQPDIAVALVRSNIWPGAFAFAAGKRFANVYIGWGHKCSTYNYNPPAMPPVQDQYKIGPEIMEIQDPTFEEEEAYRIAHLPPAPPMAEEEELIEEQEEEEEEEEDDDD